MFATTAEQTTDARMRAVEAELRDIVGAFDPDEVPVFGVTDLLTTFDAVERLAASAKTLLARRLEETGGWKRGGHRSAAEQLASVSGTSVAAAKNVLETSKRVDDLPATAAALRSGSLSPAKAEAIASAAAIAPAAEQRLLDSAHKPLGELRDECLHARAAVDRDATHERIRSQRRLREYTDAEGAWNLHATGTPEDGAAFRAAHGPIVDALFKAARTEGRRESHDAYAFDALIELANRASGSTDGSPATTRRRPSPKFLGLIRVDHEALRRGGVEDGETCEITGLGPIPAGVARDLLGDAILKLVVTKGVDVANVTHLGRSVTMAQQVALWWQSPACSVEGCTRTRRLENDHRIDWAETHHTRVDESDPFCEHHHDLKTYDGWALARGVGPRPMVPPDDPRHPNCRPPPGP